MSEENQNIKTKILEYHGIKCFRTTMKRDDGKWYARVVLAMPDGPFMYHGIYKDERKANGLILVHALKAWKIQSKRIKKLNGSDIIKRI